MAFSWNGTSRRSTGVLFILLLLGGEAARIKHNIDTQSFNSVSSSARKVAAAGQRARRDLSKANKTTMEHANDIIEGFHVSVDPSEHVEVARGWIHYNNKDMYGVWRKVADSPGEGRLDLYRLDDLDNDDFLDGDEPAAHPFRTMKIRHDDAVLMDQKPGGALIALTGQKHYWNYGSQGSPARKTMYISAVKGHHSLKMLGEEKWVDTGSEDNVIKAWLNVFRTTQTVDTCLEKGTCLLQCTYLTATGRCNSDFCKLEYITDETSRGFFGYMKSSRPRCFPREGAAEVAQGWEDLKAETRRAANHVEYSGCVANCKPDWELVSNNMKTINELGRQFTAMSEKEEEVPAFKVSGSMRTVYEQIRSDGETLSDEVAWKMSKGFDYARSGVFTALGRALANEGCHDVPDGAIHALFMIDAAPLDKKAEAQAEFQKYADMCPWFQKLTASPDEMIKKNNDVKNAVKQGLLQQNGTALLPGGANKTALLEGGKVEYIPIAEIIAIAAVVASVVTILAGLALIIRGSFCSSGKSPAVKSQQVAHAHCKAYLQTGGPCWQSHMLPGIYIMTGGFIMLAFTGLAVWATMGAGAALIPGAWEALVAGVAKVGGIATLGAMVVKIRDWFIDKDGPTNEEQYAKCMTRLADIVPAAKPVEDTPADTIIGLNELLAKTHIRPEHVDEFKMDLLGLGVYDIQELTKEDWEGLSTWKQLTKFERKRVLQYAEQH